MSPLSSKVVPGSTAFGASLATALVPAVFVALLAASSLGAARPGLAAEPVGSVRVRVPGTSLRLGDSLVQVSRVLALKSKADERLATGESAFATELRIYGQTGVATLVFADGALSRLEVELIEPSAHTRDYLEDDLRRQGFRRECTAASRIRSRCTWLGSLRVQVVMDSLRVQTIASRLEDRSSPGSSSESAAGGSGDRSPFVDALARALADSTPILPDTLDLNEENPEGLTTPKLVETTVARIPDDLRGSVERASVGVLALVALDGRVQYAEPVSGPEPFYETVLAAIRRYRFERYKTKDGPTRFWVRLSVMPF